jgi:hypothetical protein
MTNDELVALEKAVAAIQTAIQNLASKQQLKQLYNLRQQEIEEIKARLDISETQITILQKG